MFLDQVPAAFVQGGLFDAPDSPARQRLMGIIDCLNARYDVSGAEPTSWRAQML